MKILLVLTVLALLFGLIPFAIWRVLRKHHKVDVGPREVAASARVATAAARTWMLQTEVGEHGPFGLPQLQWFKDEGLLTETSCLRDPATGALRQAGEMPELFRSKPVNFSVVHGNAQASDASALAVVHVCV